MKINTVIGGTLLLSFFLVLTLVRTVSSKDDNISIESPSCTYHEDERAVLCRAKLLSNYNGTSVWEDREGFTIISRQVSADRVEPGKVYLITVKPPTRLDGLYEITSYRYLPSIKIGCTKRVQPHWTALGSDGSGGIDMNYIRIPNIVKLPRRPDYRRGDPTYLLFAEEVSYITPEEAESYGVTQCPGVFEVSPSW